MTEPTGEPRPAVPEHLLMPLLEAAADTLRTLEGDDVPPTLRHLRGFDRRGVMHGPGPRQLRRAIEHDADFRASVFERFEAVPAVQAVVDRWAQRDPSQLVAEAASQSDLALLASVLWACAPPPRAEFGLGLVVAFDTFERRDRDAARGAGERDRELGALEEALRRANDARVAAEAAAEIGAQELRDDRRARRTREEGAEAEIRAAYERAESLEAQVRQLGLELEAERTRVGRESQRARAFEEDLRKARAELADATTRMQQAPSRLDERDALELADVTTAIQRLAARLESLGARVETSSERSPRPRRDLPAGANRPSPAAPPAIPVDKPLAKRVAPQIPAGVVAASSTGIETMLKSPRVVLLVDGYNVTKRAWPDATATVQREHLGVAVSQLHRRLRCEVCCVFDGDGSGPLGPIRRDGVRVVFSDAGEEADEVVLREVQALPKGVPVVVASSDAWIREHAEREGAVVVPADALLNFLRPSR